MEKISSAFVIVMLILGTSLPVYAADGLQKEASPDANNKHVKSVTAITEVFGDGQKISAVALEYDRAINTSKLKTSDFTVEDKTITKIYANTIAAKASKGLNGNYVILELATPMISAGNGQEHPGNDAAQKDQQIINSQKMSGPTLGSRPDKQPDSPPLVAKVTQVGNITTIAGETYRANSSVITSSKTVNLVVDDFKQFVYTDPNYNNEKLMYNLYVPKNYDPSKKYPLVLFMHDAGVVGDNPTLTLTQGLGAVIWATAKNECFVLAPQYTTVIADDNSKTTEQMDITVDLVKELEKRYSIDSNRLYNTGQSMGGMTSIAMDIKYPDMFAASLLVACQWDAAKAAPMAKKNLWIVVSEGDNKAYPGMNAITKVLETQGATVSKAIWSAEASPLELAKNVKDMLEKGCNVNYTVFKNGNHRYTWQYAYTIDGIRDWLFAQVKTPKP
ncbi:alpha/beta hydrolase fold [Lucifera butyrica]|uniref:Alpha/beta hydrolase fold n=1 Tax=Lucifera butyrica TaxID=1351585 RepID=A0A498R680_9FIRM|nr:alpha/beta hydrolase-fold protein [Lucifera butyrica]VBB05723.1 alpha/beta hydrolase fold [Lucifera butyrica]